MIDHNMLENVKKWPSYQFVVYQIEIQLVKRNS